MSMAYLLYALSDDGQINSRGTAWFIRHDVVVTAFHVVADDSGVWLSDVHPNVRYQLALSSAEKLILEPVVADARVDIALLRPLKPVQEAAVLALTSDSDITREARWHTEGYPAFHDTELFGLSGSLTVINPDVSATTLQLLIDQGTRVSWQGISGAPVLLHHGVSGVITRETDNTDTVWAAPASALRSLLAFRQSSNLIEEFGHLLIARSDSPADIAHLSQLFPGELPSDEDLAHCVERLVRGAWRLGPQAFSKVLQAFAADHPDAAEIRVLQHKLAAYVHLRDEVSHSNLVAEVIQFLAQDDLPGVAVLEPLHSGARRIVEEVIKHLRDSRRPELAVRLVPRPNTDDEQRLYRVLYRHLRQGLEQEIGQPLPVYWAACLPENDTSIDEDRFREVLEDILGGPVARAGRMLVLVVEGLSRVTARHLEQWAYLMSSLAGSPNLPLKLLVWGGQELHELCRGAQHVGVFSPFQRLRYRRVGLLAADEVAQRLTRELGTPTGAEALYALTHGHPELVHECMEQAPPRTPSE